MDNVKVSKVIEYYSDKNASMPFTNELIRHMKKSIYSNDAYCQLAKTFMSRGEEGGEDDKWFYQYLCENIDKIDFFSPSMQFCLLGGPFLDDIMPSQKWHLLVSYLTFKLVISEKPKHINSQVKPIRLEDDFKYYNGCHCPELMIWMIEATDIDRESVKEAYNTAIKLYNNQAKPAEICAAIRKKISWDDILKLIEEMDNK